MPTFPCWNQENILLLFCYIRKPKSIIFWLNQYIIFSESKFCSLEITDSTFYEFWKFDKIIWKGQFSLAHSGSNAEILRYFKVKLLPLNFGFKDVDILSIESLSPKSLYSWKFKFDFKVYKILKPLFNSNWLLHKRNIENYLLFG